jgi:replication factor C small subunit
MRNLWTESHRPDTTDGYVFQNDSQRAQVHKWIAEQNIPHLLFSGGPGTGKTTLARILIKALGVNAYDVLELNASRTNSVDDVRDQITRFVSTSAFGDFKIVLLDEADYLSPNAQAALRNVMETYADNARFILTCNYPNKVIPAIHSRCQDFHISQLDQTEFTTRLAEILLSEGVEFDLDVLDTYVRGSYPDLRKSINICQQHTVNNRLEAAVSTAGSSNDYRIAAVDLIKNGKIREARQLICRQLRPEEMNDLITWAYNNLDLWSTTAEGQDQAILIIRKAAVNASLVADAEINAAAMLVELSAIQ